MSLQNVGGSGPLKNVYIKTQIVKLATEAPGANPPGTNPLGGDVRIGSGSRLVISQAGEGPSVAQASPLDLIRSVANLGELVDKLVAQEFPGTALPEQHLAKLKEFIAGELARLGLDFEQVRQSA